MKRHVTIIVAALVLIAGAVAADYVGKVHNDGPHKLVIESGGEIECKAGSTFDLAVGTITGANSDTLGVGATNNTLTLTTDSTNTGIFKCADAAGAADCLFDTTGAGAITIGSADVTTITMITDGGSVTVDGVGITPSGITADTAAGTWTFSKDSAGGAAIIGDDDAGAATLLLDVTGAGSIDIGSADVTDVQVVTDGGTLEMGTTANAATIVAAAGQTATLILADDAGAANGAIDVAGAGALTLGSSDVTSLTVTTDAAGDAEVVLPENSIGPDELAAFTDDVMLCGEADENGTIYMGPALAPFGGDGSTSYALASAGCDALDNADEPTADLPLTGMGAYKITGMWCRTDGTLGAAETLTVTLRSAAGDLTPTISCAMTEAVQTCRTVTGSTTDVAAGATLAIKVVEVSNNADDNVWCKVGIAYK